MGRVLIHTSDLGEVEGGVSCIEVTVAGNRFVLTHSAITLWEAPFQILWLEPRPSRPVAQGRSLDAVLDQFQVVLRATPFRVDLPVSTMLDALEPLCRRRVDVGRGAAQRSWTDVLRRRRRVLRRRSGSMVGGRPDPTRW